MTQDMKANAPDKIYVYIPDDDIVGTASTQKGFPHQFVTEEYTRTDAFIDKAVTFLESTDFCKFYNKEFIDEFIRKMEE